MSRSRLVEPRTAVFALLVFTSFALYSRFIGEFKEVRNYPVLESVWSAHAVLWWELWVVIIVALVALYSYRTRNILSAWLLTFAWGAGLGVNLGGIGITGSMPGLGFRLLWATGLGLVSAVTMGSAAYILGVYGPKAWSRIRRSGDTRLAVMAIVSAIIGVGGYLILTPASDGAVMVVLAIGVFAVLMFADGFLSAL